MSANDLFSGMSRRQFLATTAAAAVATSLPLRAQYKSPTAQYTRISLTDPGAPAMLDSYATAIKALLKLPPTDPRNFYRNAFIHTLDCPHGNWWFLPWHRGYLGWWEQTVRSLSGNPKFAFPYWDWTAQPFVPDAFWQGVLNPSASEYISSWSDFQTQLRPAMTAFYASFTAAQRTQLGARGLPTVNVLFNAAQGMFFPPSEARSLTQSAPNFDPATQQAVSLPTIEAALANTTFTGPDGGFGSDVATQHSQGVGYGILEGQPHNNVHGNVGGFMGNFLSTVDPIFMAHHANIDRLWWVWTAKQTAAGLPTLADAPPARALAAGAVPVLHQPPGPARHAEHGRRLRDHRPVQLHVHGGVRKRRCLVEGHRRADRHREEGHGLAQSHRSELREGRHRRGHASGADARVDEGGQRTAALRARHDPAAGRSTRRPRPRPREPAGKRVVARLPSSELCRHVRVFRQAASRESNHLHRGSP